VFQELEIGGLNIPGRTLDKTPDEGLALKPFMNVNDRINHQ
jgi:hypothetical protein